jgi:hypothetical protein
MACVLRCFTCHVDGHAADACKQTCPNCLGSEHASVWCFNGRRCPHCASRTHLSKDCPEKHDSHGNVRFAPTIHPRGV